MTDVPLKVCCSGGFFQTDWRKLRNGKGRRDLRAKGRTYLTISKRCIKMGKWTPRRQEGTLGLPVLLSTELEFLLLCITTNCWFLHSTSMLHFPFRCKGCYWNLASRLNLWVFVIPSLQIIHRIKFKWWALCAAEFPGMHAAGFCKLG